MRSSTGSTITTAASAPSRALRASCANSTDPGQSRTVSTVPLHVVVAALTSVLIWRSRASVDASPTVLPSPDLPLRLMRPVTNSRLSSSVVLPVPFGPTKATLRTEVPAAIGFSLTGWTWPSRDGAHLAGAPWTTFAGSMLGQAAGPRQLENHRIVTTDRRAGVTVACFFLLVPLAAPPSPLAGPPRQGWHASSTRGHYFQSSQSMGRFSATSFRLRQDAHGNR